MKNLLVDQTGTVRCNKCKGRNFIYKRTFRSKFMGMFCLLTKKKAKCVGCGEYNDTGNVKHWHDPALQQPGVQPPTAP